MRGRAQPLDRRHVVADKYDRSPVLRDLAHLAQALSLKRAVADRQHFVDEKDLGLQVSGDRERQPDVHAARIVLDRRVDELADFGELDDIVELRLISARFMPRIAPFR